MGTGWVPGGVYRVPSQLLGEGPGTAKRAPEAPAGCWSGWYQGPGAQPCNMGPWDGGGTAPAPTLRARSVPFWALPGAEPSECRLSANKGEIPALFL